MCAHDDEVHLSRLGGVDNLLKGDAVQDDTLSRESGRRHTRQRGFHAALHFRFQLPQGGLRQYHTHVDPCHGEGLNDMEHRQTRVECACQADGVVQRLLGIDAKIARYEKMLCGHRMTLSCFSVH